MPSPNPLITPLKALHSHKNPKLPFPETYTLLIPETPILEASLTPFEVIIKIIPRKHP
jgi:hypothetical protein